MSQLPQNLVAHTIALTGKHLIEASAGTGKTFNITRIYLRLLLERELTVEQILVMTFTKDATEELRGRIDAFIREALNNWSALCEKDEYFIALRAKVSDERAQFLLKRALLFLDEAAIYTIHGFCKRVLNQHAFTSGLPFNAQMEADTKAITLEACQDWYRTTAQNQPNALLLLAEFWPDPITFINHFNKAIGHTGELDVLSVASISDDFKNLAKAALFSLNSNHTLLETSLIEVKKGDAKALREQELASLKQWLTDISTQDFDLKQLSQAAFSMPDAFIDGRRFARSKTKAELVDAFIEVNKVKAQAKKLVKQLNKAEAFTIVRQAIYTIRADIEAKKQQQNLLNFDDLIKTLATCLTQPSATGSLNGATVNNPLAEKLFAQYPVALVDEFQDTDPQQYAILQAIYSDKNLSSSTEEPAALYLIGDPKQAIYGFRGGDVFAYLCARNDCQYQWLMDTNWRSTSAMIAGYNQLFVGEHLLASNSSDELPNTSAIFGYNIPYIPVKASPIADNKAAIDNKFHALQFVHFTSEEDGKVQKQGFRPVMANWCATEIVCLLSDEYETCKNAIALQDIAILVRDGTEANAIKQALESVGLASVFLSNRANLLHSKQTTQLIALLKGVLFVENERLFIAALCCGLLGFNASKLQQLQHDELAYQTLKFTFVALRNEWQKRGFISMALQLMHEHFQLPEQDKDRCLTNLLHLFELLQAASQRHKQPQELLYWFEQQSVLENPETEAELRLESDDDLIRIVTQHGAKGLEYPVVFVPFSTRHKDPLTIGKRAVNYIEYHDQQGQLCLSLDASLEAKQAMANEAYAESIRLLYVAITRAEQRCYVLTTPFEGAHLSPLGQTLKWQKDNDIMGDLQKIVDLAPHAIGLHCVRGSEHEADSLSLGCLPLSRLSVSKNEDNIQVESKAQVSKFTGNIQRDWWLSSFTALSRNLRHGGVSTPDRDNDLAAVNTLTTAVDTQAAAIKAINESLLRFNLVKGAHSGNLLHDILEHTDFVEPDWLQVCKWPLVGYGDLPQGFTEQHLYQWLQQVLETPLPESDCLANIPLSKTLRESEFYFPMEKARSGQLAKLLTDHRNCAPVISSVNNSRNNLVKLPSYQTLTGMMHGFVDLIFQDQGKYYVCDYKSSHLGNDFDDYHHDALLINVEKNYYDLQYLIYCLALHRHLKHSLADYDIEQHFGGIYYFYLRGMAGNNSETNTYNGVYYRKITAAELIQLDDIFSGAIS